MSACEECWTEATRKAFMLGGSTVDRYKAELEAHPEHETEARVPVRSIVGNSDRAIAAWLGAWLNRGRKCGSLPPKEES